MGEGRHLSRSTGAAAALACCVLALALPGTAQAAGIVAGPSTVYLTPGVSMAQGEPLTFYNFDIIGHDVTAATNGPDGKPLFATPIIGLGDSAAVEGSEYLTAGSYDFLCSIHPNMTGTVTVTSAGTPVPRPGPGNPAPADTVKPRLSVNVRSASASKVRRQRKLSVSIAVDEASTITLTATTRAGGKAVKLAGGSVKLTGAGTRRLQLGLTAAGRRALKKARAVTLSARAVDLAGNASTATAPRRLGR